jgi:DNA-binding CsgD family transcriptional regulator
MTELLDGIDTAELRGRRQKSMSAVAVRPLQEADLAVLAQGERAPTPPRSIARLRDRHHAIARLLAAGKTNNEVSIMTGMDPARISVLRGDPTFKQLVEDYRKIETGQEADFLERLQMLGMTVVEELQDRLENSEEPVPIQTLLEVSKFAADRIGHGPVTKQMNTSVNLDLSGRLASARRRALIAPPVDAEFTEVKNGTDG